MTNRIRVDVAAGYASRHVISRKYTRRKLRQGSLNTAVHDSYNDVSSSTQAPRRAQVPPLDPPLHFLDVLTIDRSLCCHTCGRVGLNEQETRRHESPCRDTKHAPPA